MSLSNRLEKIKKDKAAETQQALKEWGNAEAKRKKELQDKRNNFSKFLHDHIDPILAETNRTLADGNGLIKEKKYEPNSEPYLELKWDIFKWSVDDDAYEGGFRVIIGSSTDFKKVWIKVGQEDKGIKFSLNNNMWKDKIKDRIAVMYEKNLMHYEQSL